MLNALASSLILSERDFADLERAVSILEKPSLAGKLSQWLGTPLEALKKSLPNAVQAPLEKAVHSSVQWAWKAARWSHPAAFGKTAPLWMHRGALSVSGALGGFGGWSTTLVELPVSTALLLRHIAHEAALQGEDISSTEAQMECLKVFAFGSPETKTLEPLDTGYLATRLALTQMLPNAASAATSVFLPSFMGVVAARFANSMGLKISAQSLPVVGASVGLALNMIFLEHFRSIAWAHFTLRRLERQYPETTVQTVYQQVALEEAEKKEA